jgi:hypothetical protein
MWNLYICYSHSNYITCIYGKVVESVETGELSWKRVTVWDL